MKDDKLDIGKLAHGKTSDQNQPSDVSIPVERKEDSTDMRIVSSENSRPAVIQSAEVGWMQATQGLQRHIVIALQDYKVSRSEKKVTAAVRERAIHEVADYYVNYLREEAKLASDAALEAKDAILRQELAKLRKELYLEIAEIAGTGVVEIERIFEANAAKIKSDELRERYATFVWGKILKLLEQSDK